MKKEKINENNILLHMPHTNTIIPDDMGKLLVSKEEIFEFSNLISDLKIHDLFDHNIGQRYIAPYSRVFCDVEKFIDDSLEVMSKYGQGVFYERDSKGKKIRSVSEEYKQKIISDYYIPYHKGLDELTLSLLEKKLIIVDCHSYSEECVLHNKAESYTDIDLGFDDQYFSNDLIDGVSQIFLKNGYSVSYNKPYEGTLIPNAIYNKNIPNVLCLMIEINKRTYLSDTKLYDNCKATIKEVLEYIKYF